MDRGDDLTRRKLRAGCVGGLLFLVCALVYGGQMLPYAVDSPLATEGLLRLGADPNEPGADALCWAARRGEAGSVRALLDAGADPNTRTEWPQRKTPLHEAAACGDVEIARMLLAAGAEINAADWTGQTPLHYAAESGQSAAAEFLLESGADPSVRDRDGLSPADTARSAGHGELAEELEAALGAAQHSVESDQASVGGSGGE